MLTEMWHLEKVRPYERNPRHNENAVAGVAESIRRFGFRQPIVVDLEGVIVCGHTRYLAARTLGLEAVPVHVATDLTPQQSLAYRILSGFREEVTDVLEAEGCRGRKDRDADCHTTSTRVPG